MTHKRILNVHYQFEIFITFLFYLTHRLFQSVSPNCQMSGRQKIFPRYLPGTILSLILLWLENIQYHFIVLKFIKILFGET